MWLASQPEIFTCHFLYASDHRQFPIENPTIPKHNNNRQLYWKVELCVCCQPPHDEAKWHGYLSKRSVGWGWELSCLGIAILSERKWPWKMLAGQSMHTFSFWSAIFAASSLFFCPNCPARGICFIERLPKLPRPMLVMYAFSMLATWPSVTQEQYIRLSVGIWGRAYFLMKCSFKCVECLLEDKTPPPVRHHRFSKAEVENGYPVRVMIMVWGLPS
jgi:hypothetical protein